ncbi:MAG: motility associated factor glycosyltransferase family protein [Bacillota bacterium]
MKQVYQKNLKALAQKNKVLADKIKKLEVEKKDFSIVPTKDKANYILEIKVNTKIKQVNSSYNPYSGAERKIDKLDLKYYNLIGVMGIGCGYYIEEILNRFNKDSRLVIWENRLDILKEVIKYRDLTHVFNSKKVEIFDGTNSNYYINMKQKLKNIVYMALLAGNVDFFELPVLKEKEKKAYDKFKTQFISLMRYLAFIMGTSSLDSLVGVENIFKNIEYLLKSKSLEKINKFKNKPAVCVAAGPSLDKNIDVLKEYQEQVLILAADTVLSKLLAHNIIPDIVGVLERTTGPYEYFFKDLIKDSDDQLLNQMTLVAEGVIDERIYNNFSGLKLVTLRKTVYSESWFANNINSVTGYDTGNSVANLNFSTALALNCSPIILIGQDLAFGENDKQHVTGTGYEKKGEKNIKGNEIMYVDGYYGGKVKTRRKWWQFKKWFEYKIAETNITCIDATEGGAYIKGTIKKSLQEAIKENSNNVLPSFCEMINKPSRINVINEGEKLIKRLNDKREIFVEIKDKAFLIKSWIKEVLNKLETINEYQDINDYIFDIFPEINRELVLLTRKDPFFSFICQPITIEMERAKVRKGRLENNTETKFNRWCNKNLDNLQDIEKICEELIDYFDDGIDKVEKIVNEEETKLNEIQ